MNVRQLNCVLTSGNLLEPVVRDNAELVVIVPVLGFSRSLTVLRCLVDIMNFSPEHDFSCHLVIFPPSHRTGSST